MIDSDSEMAVIGTRVNFIDVSDVPVTDIRYRRLV